MLQNTYKGIKLKIVYKNVGISNKKDITKFLELNILSKYDEFLLELKKSQYNDINENILIFLKYSEDEMQVNKNSFEKIKKIIYSRTNADETYIIVQGLKDMRGTESGKCGLGLGEKLVHKDHKENKE